MNDERYLALVAYGLRLLGQATSQQEGSEGLMGALPNLPEWKWEIYERLLGCKPSPEKVLSSLFSWVALPDQGGSEPYPGRRTTWHGR